MQSFRGRIPGPLLERCKLSLVLRFNVDAHLYILMPGCPTIPVGGVTAGLYGAIPGIAFGPAAGDPLPGYE